MGGPLERRRTSSHTSSSALPTTDPDPVSAALASIVAHAEAATLDRPADGLHHRHVRSGSGDYTADEFERGYAYTTTAAGSAGAGGGAGSNSNAMNAHPAAAATGGGASMNPALKFPSKKRRTGIGIARYPCGRWIQTCLLASIPAYLFLIFLFLKSINQQTALHRQHGVWQSSQRRYNEEDIVMVRDLYVTSATQQKRWIRQRDEQSATDAAAAVHHALVRATKRQAHTRPSNSASSSTTLSATPWLAVTARPQLASIPRAASKRSKVVSELCGTAAQAAARTTPDAYTVRDALLQSRTIVRVLITGIVTSQPAHRLALALKDACRVDVLVGFDNLYPNSIRHRLRLLEPLAALTKFIPKLVRPIFLSHVGLDPARHSQSFVTLAGTEELDLFQTVKPTHIVHLAGHDPSLVRHSDPDWKNGQSPYVRPSHDPSLYQLRSGLVSMEQILASLAAAPPNHRPHLVYASAHMPPLRDPSRSRSRDSLMHVWARRLDEMLADFYAQTYGVYSIGLRLPTVYGPMGHVESELHQLVEQTVLRNATRQALDANHSSTMELLHVDDVVDGVVAAMQYRPPDATAVVLELHARGRTSYPQVQRAVEQILDPRVVVNVTESHTHDTSRVQRSLGWTPRISLREGLIRTVAWYVDRAHPFGPPLDHGNRSVARVETGDAILKRHALTTCSPDHVVCHLGRPILPCASECSSRDQCVPTGFDTLIPVVQELTEECDIVMYTHNFDPTATDLSLQSEFVESGTPLVCNFAFIHAQSPLVGAVIGKVPDSELGKLGLDLAQLTALRPSEIAAQKHEKLNGRLLYRGWILIWMKGDTDGLPIHERFLLKLSPGRLFHHDVKSAVYIDQQFGVSPKADDIKFLVHEMRRKPWSSRVVKRKTRPKAKFLLPSEPSRQAVLLMSVLKYQDSSEATHLAPDVKISTYEATRFMRYSNGEEPLSKEPPEIKLQREFYDRIRGSINPDNARWPGEPVHKFELSHWARSRWVAHDLVLEESRQLRCEWYQEHVLWDTELDQLSFAFVMEKREIDRKLSFHEPDESVQKQLRENTEMKKLLSDTFEWHALKTDANKRYSPYQEMKVLPYDMDSAEERALVESSVETDGENPPLFVRIISDRIMAYARKSWNNPSETTEHVKTEL